MPEPLGRASIPELASRPVPAEQLARLARLRAAILDAKYGLCTQLAELMTESMQHDAPQPALTRKLAPLHFSGTRKSLEASLANGAPAPHWQLSLSKRLQKLWMHVDEHAIAQGETGPTIVSLAKALAHTLAHAQLGIYPDELLVGNPTRHRVGAALHPDYGGMLLLPELATLGSRPVNPLAVTDEQRERLEHDIFPYWFTRSVMARAPVFASDLELQNKLTDGRRFVLTQFAGIAHVTPDFPSVLELGFVGIREQLRALAPGAQTDEQRAFYAAGEIVATAVIEFGARWCRHCEQEATRLEPDQPERAKELRELAEVFARVPAEPARSFHEALQSVVTTWVALQHESFQHGVSFGRVDQYLWPYYQRDVAAGRLDPARAVELIGCFLGKAAEQLPLFNQLATEFFSGLSSAAGLTIGGTHPTGADAGTDASNELSYLFLHAYDRMRLRQPNLHLRMHASTPAPLRQLAFELIGDGGGQPALFNDEQVIAALHELGVAEADARNYSIVGCVEWGVPYCSFPAAGAGFVSLPAVLDAALHDEALREVVRGGGAVVQYVWDEFAKRLEATIAEVVDGNDAIERAHMQCRPTPLLSLVVGGCLEAGRDVTAGGARYDSTGVQGVGLADVADSLTVIELLVGTGSLSLNELMTAVDADFEGHEPLRRRLLEKLPKYGQDRGVPEAWAVRVARAYADKLRAHHNVRGGPYAPGFWSMTTHVGFGVRLGALPSGRKAKRPFANGASPSNGADDRGPTASLLAAVHAGGVHVSNGLALNESLDPSFARGPRGAVIVDALTRGYFDAGGMHVQYNVIDVAELIDAKLHPERHRGLVVRISGYSAYFNDLTSAMKDEIIARSLHGRPACQIVEAQA